MKLQLIEATKSGKNPSQAGRILGFNKSHVWKIWCKFQEIDTVED
jgi:hypothetical protein